MRFGDAGEDAQVVAERAILGGAGEQTATRASISEVTDLDATVADAFEILKFILAHSIVHLGDEGALDPLPVVRLSA